MASEPPREPIKSTIDSQLDKAIGREASDLGDSEASQQADTLKKLDKRPKKEVVKDGDDDNKWKIIGGAVALVAAIALGGVAVKQRKPKKEKVEEETHGLLDEAGRKLKGSGRWIGDKAETVKDKAGNVSDDVGPRIKGAATATKDKVGDIIPSSVSNTATTIKDRAEITGIKMEKEGLKASEKSDAAVRDTADKVIHGSGKAARKIDAKSGGFFSGIGNWLADRRDDTVGIVGSAADKVGGAAEGAGKAAKGK